MLRSSIALLMLAATALVVTTVPVGRRTLLEHGAAILSTEPAQQLGEDLVATAESIKSRIVGALEAVAAAPARPDDAARVP